MNSATITGYASTPGVVPDNVLSALQDKANAELGGQLSFDDFKKYVEMAGKVEKTGVICLCAL